jgi:hypothetical protein
MTSLFSIPGNEAMLERIKKLSTDSNAQWGKMNAAQMLAHCQFPIKVAFGEMKLKKTFVGMLFGGIAKRKMVNDKPFSKNLPTDKNFIINVHPELEAEKQQLIMLVKRFAELGPGGISNERHPFFGKLTTKNGTCLHGNI